MNMAFARTDHSTVGRWWWTVDRWTLVALAVLIGVGALLVTAASPSVADRIHVPTFYFVIHQGIMLVPTLILMIGVSLLSPRSVRRLAFGAFAVFFAAKGAQPAGGHTNVGGVDVPVDIEIGDVTVQTLTHMVGQPAYGEYIA